MRWDKDEENVFEDFNKLIYITKIKERKVKEKRDREDR